MAAFKVFVGPNFVCDGVADLPTDKSYISRKDVQYDERTHFLTSELDLTNWNWYYNYLSFNYVEARKNSDAKANYLLDLGYIPIVYMPTCLEAIGVKLFEVLDRKKIPYIKVRASSFTRKHFDSQMVDGWISKMDAAKLLGTRPDDVRSEDVLGGLVLNGK